MLVMPFLLLSQCWYVVCSQVVQAVSAWAASSEPGSTQPSAPILEPLGGSYNQYSQGLGRAAQAIQAELQWAKGVNWGSKGLR